MCVVATSGSRDGPTVDTHSRAVSARPALFAEYRSDTSTPRFPFPQPGYPLPIPLTSTLVVSFPPDRRSTASICELQECAPRAQRAPMPRPGSSGWHPKHSPVPVARLKIYPSLFHSALLSISLRPFIPYDSPAQAARYPLIPLARGELMLLSL